MHRKSRTVATSVRAILVPLVALVVATSAAIPTSLLTAASTAWD